MSNLNPWDIIGWSLIVALIAWFGFSLGKAVVLAVTQWALRWYFHLTTRNTPPAKGQVWDNNYGSTIRITHIGQRDDGSTYYAVQAGNASWGEGPESWKQRVKGRRMFLISEAK